MSLSETAHAKINLTLHVTGKRPDGYHILDSLAVFASAADTLSYIPSGSPLSLELTGPFGQTLATEACDDNLVIRAARLLAEGRTVEQTGRVILEKNLPVASGIGGGSADAAATLRLLDRVWGLNTPADRLHTIATRLGADVPVCLAQKPARMGGIGEQLSPAPTLPDCGMILINCGEAVSTPAVFRARVNTFSPAASFPASWPDAKTMATDLARLTNDLEAPACEICPAIRTVLTTIASLPDCRLSRMSGSGATCFGLFDSPDAARTAAQALSSNPTAATWWIQAGPLASRSLTDVTQKN